MRESHRPKPVKTDVCEKIVRYVIAKYKDRKQRRQGSVASAVTSRLIDVEPEPEPEPDRPGHLSRDTSIAAALKNIPSSLFAVDCDRRQPTSLAPVNVSGDPTCRKIVSVMSAPCICMETANCGKVMSADQSVFSPYHEVQRFPSRHRRQPCMYHDKLFWSFEIASGRDQLTRVEATHRDRVVTSEKAGSNPGHWQTISACDGASGRKSEARNNSAVARDSAPLMQSAIPHIAVTPTDDRQVAPDKKTAMVTVHQAAVSVDDCDVTDLCLSPDIGEQFVSDSEHSDRAATSPDLAAVGVSTDCTPASPADTGDVMSQRNYDDAVTLPPLSDVTTTLNDITTTLRDVTNTSRDENRTGYLHNHVYII